ncbi:hypothetical protein A0H81_14001 [Grifola frondosa]|uniref:Uncharacterized protein n=1 Tax=Grifola frondosa TaxID=5627 RepID=A0A1C7LN90_GRIFR|nr:hypothetical protein A0H81_14001 [Grifola frondosa]
MAPSISSLTVFTDPHDDDDQNLDAILKAVSTISPMLCFSALRKLEVEFSSDAPDLFEKFSRLDYLNHLVISHEVGMARPIGRGCFAALQNIEFWVRGEDPLLELLTDFSFPRLQSALFSIDGPSDITASRRILDALCSGSPSLCALTLNYQQREIIEHPPMELLEPLLALSGMKELEISTTGGLCVSKDDIRTMARSWPELKSLHLSYRRGGPAPPIQSIIEFAHHCPHLQQLYFPHFICDSPTFPTTSAHSLCCKRSLLKSGRLDIDVNDVELCQKAAEFIEGIFPSEEHWEDTTVHNAGWQTVSPRTLLWFSAC